MICLKLTFCHVNPQDLRMAVRSSVYKKVTENHQHVFGAEQFDAERDIYYRKCSTCSFQQEYEKM